MEYRVHVKTSTDRWVHGVGLINIIAAPRIGLTHGEVPSEIEGGGWSNSFEITLPPLAELNSLQVTTSDTSAELTLDEPVTSEFETRIKGRLHGYASPPIFADLALNSPPSVIAVRAQAKILDSQWSKSVEFALHSAPQLRTFPSKLVLKGSAPAHGQFRVQGVDEGQLVFACVPEGAAVLSWDFERSSIRLETSKDSPRAFVVVVSDSQRSATVPICTSATPPAER